MISAQARLTIRNAIKMALPYGVVRAIQISHERNQLRAELERVSSDLARLHSEFQDLSAGRLRQPEAETANPDAAARELALRLEVEREAFTCNEVVVDGRRIYSRSEAPLIDLRIDGRDHAIHINHPTGPGTLHVLTQPGTSGCQLKFGADNRVASNVFINFANSGGSTATNSIIDIGDGNLFNGNVHVTAGISPSTRVSIGKENLFADNIQIVGAVEHLTYNVATMARESIEHGVKIEDRVWVCKDALIFNKSEIASSNVVAARAVTNRRFEESNTVIAGSPARVAKRGVMWHLNTTDDYLTHPAPLEIAG